MKARWEKQHPLRDNKVKKNERRNERKKAKRIRKLWNKRKRRREKKSWNNHHDCCYRHPQRSTIYTYIVDLSENYWSNQNLRFKWALNMYNKIDSAHTFVRWLLYVRASHVHVRCMLANVSMCLCLPCSRILHLHLFLHPAFLFALILVRATALDSTSHAFSQFC